MGNAVDWSQFCKLGRITIPNGNMQASKIDSCFVKGCQSLMAFIEKIIMNRVEMQ